VDEIQRRLSKCFCTVFPMLRNAQLASIDTLPDWDSVAHLTLLAVIGEEFGVELDLEAFQEKTSFNSIETYLRNLLTHG